MTDNNLYLDLIKDALTASLYDESAWAVRRPGKGTRLCRLLCGAREAGNAFELDKKAFNQAARDEGRDWPLFGYTMVGRKRLDNVQMCVEDVLRNQVPGDLMETGVWRGGTTIFMRALLKAHGVTDRKVWAADSFAGLPPPVDEHDGHDLSGVDLLKVSLEQVKRHFAKFRLLDEQVEFLQGWFSDTLPNAPISQLAVLRLDGDLYSSTMDALENLYHKVSKGGYVIVDDYYSWPSCRRAVSDFLAERSIAVDIRPIDWTGAYWQV